MDTKQVYFIDKKILSVFQNLQSEEEATLAYDDFLGQQDLLRLVAVQSFLSSKGVAENIIQEYLRYLQLNLSELSEESAEIVTENTTNQAKSLPIDQVQLITTLLNTEESAEYVENFIQANNRLLYEEADKKLTKEQKQELNAYLIGIDQAMTQTKSEVIKSALEMIKIQREKSGQVGVVAQPQPATSQSGSQPQSQPNVTSPTITQAAPVVQPIAPVTPTIPQVTLTQK